MTDILKGKYSTVGDPVFGLVPKGRQVLRAVAFGRGETSKNNYPQIRLRLSVVGSPSANAVGMTLNHKITIMEEARPWLSEFLRAFNRGDWEGHLGDDAEMMPLTLGRIVAGHVVHDVNSESGKTYANLDRLEAATAVEVARYGDVPWERYKNEGFGKKTGRGALQPNVTPRGTFKDDDIPF